ncbi:MAG TPA: exopolysaccharide biosynthesis protein [Thermoanaerobaculia bacterium]|jgi:hypothetical protein
MSVTMDDDGEPIAEKLMAAIERLPPEGVTLVEIRDLVGREGIMLLTAFLTIIFLVPVSIPGVSTVFGGAILLLSFSRLLNRPIWLPDWLKRRAVSSEKLRGGMARGLKWFRRLERISRPLRMRGLTSGRFMSVVNNSALILGAVLLMAPFGLIPFSNTLPAVAILFFAIGMMQRDGVCILLGHLMNVATLVYFGILIGGGAVAIQKAIEKIF